MTHTDGENRRLMPLYLRANFDIADSVCPAPMTRLSVDEFYEGFAGPHHDLGRHSLRFCCVRTARATRSFAAGLTTGRTLRAARAASCSASATWSRPTARWDRLAYVTGRIESL